MNGGDGQFHRPRAVFKRDETIARPADFPRLRNIGIFYAESMENPPEAFLTCRWKQRMRIGLERDDVVGHIPRQRRVEIGEAADAHALHRTRRTVSTRFIGHS